jgi:hypothetical protein
MPKTPPKLTAKEREAALAAAAKARRARAHMKEQLGAGHVSDAPAIRQEDRGT